MNIQKQIDKLIIAFKQQDKIIKISVDENYSLKFKKVFRIYKIYETTETEILLKREFYKLRKEYKNKIKPPEIEEKLDTMKKELENIRVPKVELKNKIEVLKYLANRYKELIE